MNREILFRGYTGRNWQYGYLIDKETIRNFDKNGLPISTYRVIKETIGQYTGLTDKNGTKIFEGDIIKSSYYTYLIVFDRYGWDSGCGLTGFIGIDKNDLKFGRYEYYNFYEANRDIYDEEIEVIGNIHDNPELLEGL